MSRSFSLGVLIYVLFIIVLDHGYLQKEEPLAGIHLTVKMVRPRRRRCSRAPLTLASRSRR